MYEFPLGVPHKGFCCRLFLGKILSKELNTMKRILSIVCLVLIVAALVLQFTPYWSYDGQDFSVGDMVWLPDEKVNKPLHKGIEAEFKAEYTAEELKTTEVKAELKQKTYVMGLARGLVVAQVAGALAVVFYFVMKKKSAVPGILMLLSGVFGAVTFLTNDMLKLGSTQMLISILYILITVVAVAALIPWTAFKKKAAKAA